MNLALWHFGTSGTNGTNSSRLTLVFCGGRCAFAKFLKNYNRSLKLAHFADFV